MRILVCGGGVGGLTSAIALQMQGFEVQLYESASHFAPVGAGITLAYNAMQVMRRLGLEPALVGAGHPLRKAVICDRHLRTLSANGLEELEQEFGVPFIGIPRYALHDALLSVLPYDNLHLGKAVQRYSTTESGAMAHFSDGSTAEGDLLICADGLHSAGRKQMFPSIEPCYAGQTSWRGMLSADTVPFEPHQAVEAWGPGTRFGALQVSSDFLYWFAVEASKPGLKPSHDPQHKDDVRRMMMPYHSTLRAIVDHTPPEQILRTDIWDLPALPVWHQGRIVLLGDAAHASTPNLGQGAAQAIEDAYCLALCLAKFTREEALSNYWQWRHQKAEWVVTASRRIGWVGGWRHPLAARTRDLLLRLTPASRTAETLRQIGQLDWLLP
jgi:2-polyprenyl-6-methoxyphenol hydroxylase-like FAD-dependent oxidoreductase